MEARRILLVPTLCVGTQDRAALRPLRLGNAFATQERRGRRSHAERGNEDS